MINKNRLIIIAVLSIALVAACSVANAAITVRVDKVQVNGNYIGIPELLNSEYPQYGYSYEFTPDGTYTVFGTITNDDADNDVEVWVGAGTKAMCEVSDTFTVPADGKKSFTFTFAAASEDDVTVGYEVGEEKTHFLDLSNVEFVDEEDTTTHTIDYGPMSDTVAIYSNGVLTYSGSPQYSVALF